MTTPEQPPCIRTGPPCQACRALAQAYRKQAEGRHPWTPAQMDQIIATARKLQAECHEAERTHYGLTGRRWRKL